MASSLHDPRYKRILEMMVSARKSAGLTQRDVAARLKQPPSYIGKLESLQRRLDVIEMIDVLDAIGVKPTKFIAEMIADLKRR